MDIKFNVTFCVDTPINIPDVINSDTIGDYKAKLDCAIGDAAMNLLMYCNMKGSFLLNSAEPANDSIEAIEEYGKYLEYWINEYPKRLAECQEKLKQYESSEKL